MTKIDRRGDDRISLVVRLVPRAARDEIIGWTADDSLKVRVTAPPVDRKANRALVELLASALGVPRADVELVSGHQSRRKRVAVPASCENRLLSISDI